MGSQSKNEGHTRTDVAAISARPTAEVLIIGGGINGIATFRDLALQGVDVVLVERGDYVSGASSASSHMIHGGVRYLENGELRLVRESVQERNGLLKTAPHYVKPLKTTIPIFSTVSGVLNAPIRLLSHKQRSTKERGAALIKIGLTLYDSFSRDGGSVPRHEFRGRKASLAQLPALNPDIKFTATYYDASMHDPERLALDVLRDGQNAGAHAAGAHAADKNAAGNRARSANYLEAVALTAEGVRVRDRVTGNEFTIASDVVVNTSGPWTDVTNGALGMPTTFMGGTKGSHIVLDHPDLYNELAGRELFFENNDGRIVLIYPLKGRVMVGTTDIEADVNEVSVCTEDEVDYFFDLVKHVFPAFTLNRSQIVFRFAGIRPLPQHDDEAPGFVSRDYRIERAPIFARPGATLISLVGGKWTTFRALAEHLGNEILGLLGKPRTVSTEGLAIGGGVGFPTTEDTLRVWLASNGDLIGTCRAEALLNRYGTRASDVIDYITEHGDVMLDSTSEYTRTELQFLVADESVVHLDDVFLRRTSLAFTGSITPAVLEEVADVVAAGLGWDDAHRAEEVSRVRTLLADVHGVVIPAAAQTRATATAS
ncbi:glycerol-3-phosphate dehydrogenase [Glaciihabitans tibetensis]|uniref:Glycerol-3-phosphate dehydrogenase n=1 Tax=Glaciihabitans tibetensis TaxID=1266600 RepID=A0A2T0VC34_9MICO|nr:glycerol-3-phosphate dehydrogenase/oxidase [Glaciihabitans tibetensis]PRY67657.1 glycerol-3-phosphate dehydrogenase [Glaciihabitans tibetensis]